MIIENKEGLFRRIGPLQHCLSEKPLPAIIRGARSPLMRTISHRLFVFALVCFASIARADDWPQWMGPQRDGVWRETGIIESIPTGGPKVLWRVSVSPG